MQKPTIGAIVHYYSGDQLPSKPRAAIVTGLHEDDTSEVSLFAFTPNRLIRRVKFSAEPAAGHWSWRQEPISSYAFSDPFSESMAASKKIMSEAAAKVFARNLVNLDQLIAEIITTSLSGPARIVILVSTRGEAVEITDRIRQALPLGVIASLGDLPDSDGTFSNRIIRMHGYNVLHSTATHPVAYLATHKDVDLMVATSFLDPAVRKRIEERCRLLDFQP